MKYMINVDLETMNISGGATDCRSALHEGHGRHYDLTVHALGCRHRQGTGTHRPPSRYWDDNEGAGYTLEEVIERIRILQSQHKRAYGRRSRACGVESQPPHWD